MQQTSLTDAWLCDKIFVKAGNAVSFRPDSELYGSGFIIDGNRIRGQPAKCEIKSRRESRLVTHLIASWRNRYNVFERAVQLEGGRR